MKRYIPLIFVILFPYYPIVATLSSLVRSDTSHLLQYIEKNLYFTIFATYAAALLCSLTISILSYVMKWNAKGLLRANMIIKWVHIPAYIFTFFIGIFVPSDMLLLFFLIIFMSGLIGLSGIIRGVSEKKLSKKAAVLHGILQFVFIVDFISATFVFINVRNASKDPNLQPLAKTLP